MKATVAAVFFALAAWAQDRTPLADFEERIASYMQIHKSSGSVSSTRSSTQLEAESKALAEAIRSKRTDAKAGDVFTPPIASEFKRLIAINLKHHLKRIRASIRSGELVSAKVHVNGSYPEGVPLETMPPSLLVSLPKLPSELDYRFIGSMLVLRDATANLIIDVIPSAIVLQ